MEMNELKFSEKTKFSVICNLLEKIEKQKDRDQKVELMKHFITSFREQSKNQQDDNFYPILRLLLPHLERERGSYGIKENTLAKMYIRILGLPKDGKDAQKLLNYRATTSGKGMGDFAEVAYWVLRSRFENIQNKLTVYDINLHLDNIANKHASHDPRGVDNELHSMLLNMSPLEQKWLIRILLKSISVGLSQNRILYQFHPDAIDLLDVTSDLLKVCTKLKDPNVRLHEIEVSLFQPFKPMLSQRCDIQDVDKDIINSSNSGHYYVEIKFDGERFQLHYQDGEYKYFSRNGYDYTNTYGCNGSNGVLTPKINKCFVKDVKSCILDGEMMCWHKARKCFTTKGMNIDVKYVKDGDSNQACFVVFDILYLNGAVLTNKPYVERVQLLEQHIKPEEGIFMLSNKVKVTNGDEIMNLLNQAITNCEEGIVVKNPYSVYKPGSRKAGWYKIKPEYTEGLMVELDLLVIGGYYGEGRRKGLVSQFLVAVADPKKNKDGEPYLFYSVGRVGSGYRDEELAEIDKKLQEHWKRVSSSQTPSNIQWTKEKPDVWISPNLSFILQIKATEVVPSDAFKVGYTLRFPRVQRIRYDKPWSDCLTIDEFTKIRESNFGKLCGTYATKLTSADSKKQVKRPKKVLSVDEQFQSKKMRNIEQSSNIFEDKEICVLTGHNLLSKHDLESKIIEYGGSVVQHPGASTYCVISSDKNNIRVKNLIQLNKYNVVKTDWIAECIEKKKLINWSPHHFLAMTVESAEKMSSLYDRYGDSYTKTITLDFLKQIIKSADDGENPSVAEMAKLDEELFKEGNPFAIFRGCCAYFCDFSLIPDYKDKLQAKICRQIFKFYSGMECDIISDEITHVISHSKAQDPVTNIAHLKTSVHRVNEKWILDSQKAKKRLPESSPCYQ